MSLVPLEPDDVGASLVLAVDLHGDGTTTLRLSGDVDHSHQRELQTVVDMLERHRPRELRIDVSGVTFSDSTLVDLAMNARARLGRRGGAVHVVEAPPQVRRVFELLDADQLLDGLADASPLTVWLPADVGREPDPRGRIVGR